MEVNTYENAWASSLAIAKKFAFQNPEYGLTPWDFDENANEQDFPDGNLIGIYQFDYSEDDTMITTNLMFVLSINNTFKQNEAVGKLVNMVRSQTRHPFIHYGNGQQMGTMVALNNLNVSPVSKSTNRQFKFILQSFGFDRTTSAQPVL